MNKIPRANSNRTGKLVFIVDDNPGCRRAFQLILEPTGYVIRTFEDRQVAYQALLDSHPRPDLLITDYQGLSMSAEELISRFRRVHPALKVLLVTGAGEVSRRLAHQMGADGCLTKPSGISCLRYEIIRLMDAK